MKIRSIWTVLAIISCFLFIHGGYNQPVDTLFTGLLWLVKENGIQLRYDGLPLQFIIVAVFLIISALLERKALMIVGIAALMALLGLWMYLLSSYIEFDTLSLIPFLVSSVLGIFFWLRDLPGKAIINKQKSPILCNMEPFLFHSNCVLPLHHALNFSPQF